MTIEIEKAYLLTNTSCDDSCRYCIVRKGHEVMSDETIADALKLVFSTDGQIKKVALYGGEPLLRFDRVEKAMAQISAMEDATGKEGQRFIYTNGFALDSQRLQFFHRNNVSLILSMDVCQQLWPKLRRDPGHVKRYPVKEDNLRSAIDILGPARVCGASVLLPDEAEHLMAQVRYMYETLGLEVVKILPGLGRYHWRSEHLHELGRSLSDMLRYLVNTIPGAAPKFFDLLNESITRQNMEPPCSGKRISVAEFYPDRTFGMSPCEFEMRPGEDNVNDTDRYRLGILGTTTHDDIARAVDRLDSEPRHTGLRLLSRWTERTANALAMQSGANARVGQYLTLAGQRVFA